MPRQLDTYEVDMKEAEAYFKSSQEFMKLFETTMKTLKSKRVRKISLKARGIEHFAEAVKSLYRFANDTEEIPDMPHVSDKQKLKSG